MKHRVLRSVLTILLAGVAMFDIAEGILVLTGVCAPPVNYHGTPFADPTVPMLLVAILVGGSSLLAATTVFTRHAWGFVPRGSGGPHHGRLGAHSYRDSPTVVVDLCLHRPGGHRAGRIPVDSRVFGSAAPS